MTTTKTWDALVIGSGIGGLACAAALARTGHRVLVLEQHSVAGGLTQTFSRNGYTWDVGVHYVGEMGPGDGPRAALDWLSDGAIQMAPLGAVYDTMHFPDGFEFRFSRPEAVLKRDLAQAFPAQAPEIEVFFAALEKAERAAMALFRQRALPAMLAGAYGMWHRAETRRWCETTTAAALESLVSDPKLRTLLGAQWPDYGAPPRESSFAMHAILMRNYLNGAWYPVGGARAFAAGLTPVIERAGGEVRTNAHVNELLVEGGRVTGARLKGGGEERAPRVLSTAGARSTVVRLLPSDLWYSGWAEEVTSFRPSACHVALYLGLEGDIEAGGATTSNHWFHETWDRPGELWREPQAERSVPPVMFVSFPSLKDAAHTAGAGEGHTAEVIALTNWDAFAGWEDTVRGKRPPEYRAAKDVIERNLLAQFRRRFPALAPMIRYHELSTPLSTASITGARQGAMYGLEASPRRFLSASLRAKTPLRGLYLAGQDVATPGVVGAMMGGLLAACAVDPRIFRHLS